ncbi:ABC transporter ATP-binding protein [Butyrivibrio sp. WCD3002]|uniref:ABC transporter ATP-binding protein n=1 Tax=Butyrivibrio sp. WCD3002 TaxID=1280676 RepID=UPI00047ECB73|nr:ABC transporter ATP-binding protein [Butyrivibrio sp. WCD3002]
MERRIYKPSYVVGRLLTFVRTESKIQFVRMIFAALFIAIQPFLGVVLPKLAIGTLERYGKDAALPLAKVMAIYFVIAGFIAFMSAFLRQVTDSENMRLRMHYLALLSQKIQNMDYKYVEDASFWEKNTRAMDAGSSNGNGIELMLNLIYKAPAYLLTLIAMAVVAFTLSPVVLVVTILHCVTLMWVSVKTHDYEYSLKEERSKAQRRISYFNDTTHDFSFGKDIRIFNFRGRIIANYKKEIEAFTAVIKMVENRRFALGFLGLFTLILTNVAMYGILIYKAYQGMPVSDYTMYVALIMSMIEYMLLFGDTVTKIRNEGEYVDDFYRLMDENILTEGNLEPEKTDSVEIVFDHVTFHYPGTDVDIYKDFSFTIKKGERLAIVGVNGAGKSTLVKLICGLYEPNEGHIYVNGIDIRDWKKKNLYDLYSTVSQDFNILAFTLRENVTCGSSQPDDARVTEALERVGLGKKLKSLSKGLDQMMLKVIDEEGTDFSGGERQKLAIARALYKDAPMVIMDEPTAALDALAEAEIYENFSELVEGKTAIYISHRLASTIFCDKIALFDKEGVKEYGTHEELMAKKGMYYDMFVVQGKYYQEEAMEA